MTPSRRYHSPGCYGTRRDAAASALASILLAVFSAWLVLTPMAATASLFGSFTIKDEAELGRKFNTLLRAKLPIIEDPEITDYIKGVVERVHANMAPMPFDLTVSVVRNNSINAFAAPAGYVYVFTGLVHNFEHEAEMAGVIAHELAHVSQRHVAKRLERMQTIGLGTLAGALAGVFIGTQTRSSDNAGQASQALIAGSLAAAPAAMLSYSRQNEREADQLGLQYLTDAGYRPEGMVGAFKIIMRKSWLSGSSVPPYLTTHPGVDERIGYLEDRIANMPVDIRDRPWEDEKFHRVQTLVRARYLDPELALPYFAGGPNGPTCLDWLGRGMAYDRMRKVAEAAEAFHQAVICAPNDSLVLREAGRFQFESGQLDRAALYLQKAVLLNPRDLLALFFYARVLGEQGRTDKAAEYYQRILKRLPEEWETHYHLGRMLGQAGKLFEAHTHLAYAAVYHSDRKQAEFHLDKVRRLAETEEQKQQLAALETALNERAEFW